MFEDLEPEAPLPVPNVVRNSLALPIISLILPVVGVVVGQFAQSFEASLGISLAVVVGTAILMSVDAGMLGPRDRDAVDRGSPAMLFVGMCLMWIVVYPYVFYRRAYFVGPSLFAPALIVALLFLGGPILVGIVSPPGLPACDSQEVTNILDPLIRENYKGPPILSIGGYREVGNDEVAQRREGRCVVRTAGGEVVVRYIVHWLDRANGMFEVRILE